MRVFSQNRYPLKSAIALLFAIGLAGSISKSWAQEDSKLSLSNPPLDSEVIDELIVDLDSESYRTRQRASRKLVQHGFAAVEPLEKAIVEGKREVQIRAFRALRKIAVGVSAENTFAVERSLSRLAALDDTIVKRGAEAILTEIGPAIETVIGNHLNAKGAQVVFGNIGDVARFRQVINSIIISEDWKGTKEDLLLLRRCHRIYSLEINSDQVDTEILDIIASRRTISALELENSKLDNSAISVFKTMDRLTSLELRYIPVDDDAVEALSAMTNLTHLGLYGTRVSETGYLEIDQYFDEGVVDYRRGGFFGVRYNVGNGPCILTDVIEGTGAADAGLKVGDQILTFNGETVTLGDDFRTAVSKCYVGDEIEVEVQREDEKLKLKAKLGKWKM